MYDSSFSINVHDGMVLIVSADDHEIMTSVVPFYVACIRLSKKYERQNQTLVMAWII